MNKIAKEYRWKIAEPPDKAIVEKLAKEINVPELIARILVFRGINDYDKAKAYFRPSLDLLHDPFIMDGMELAVTRILDALKTGEKIRVFGDYDVDGTNAAAMLYLFLKEVGAEVTYYIPDRMKEGYGVSRQGIDEALTWGAKIFLAVDCGITAIEQVAYAKSLGFDVIICDHHEPGDILPDAYAVLDTLKPNDKYPFKHLCGAGVGFKLVQAIATRLGKEALLPTYLDFVTLATTADIVPLTGENRILVRIGLESINRNPRPGMKALIEGSGLRLGQITTGQIVFGLAPRINAVGRLGDAMRAVQLLTSTDPFEAQQLAKVLEEENLNRRKLDSDTFEEAQELAEAMYNVESDAALVLHQEHWHPGVVGIVASRMVEKYYKPAIMMATVDGVAKGSARSISGFNIYDALKRCEDVLLQFGGHKYAAGLTVDLTRLTEFRDTFNHIVGEMMTEELRTPQLHIDSEVSLSDINPRVVRLLKEFAPFGPNNMRPVFVARGVDIASTPRIVGKNHLRFKARQNGTTIDAIAFGLGDSLPKVQPGRKGIELVFSVEENDWGMPGGGDGKSVAYQLKVKDIR